MDNNNVIESSTGGTSTTCIYHYDNAINGIHTLRQHLNIVFNLANKVRTMSKNMVEYNKDNSSFEIKDIITFTKEILNVKENIILSRNWLDFIISDLLGTTIKGNDLKDREDIPKDSDTVDCGWDNELTIGITSPTFTSVKLFCQLNNIQRICLLRSYIDILINDYEGLIPIDSIASKNVYTFLHSAKMMLGEELLRIKSTQNYVCS